MSRLQWQFPVRRPSRTAEHPFSTGPTAAGCSVAIALLGGVAISQQATVEALLAKHATFCCGRAALADAGDFVMEGTIEAEPQPLQLRTFVRRRPFGFRQEVFAAGAPPTLVRISDGRHAWRPDANDKCTLLFGDDARPFLEVAFLDGLRYLEPGALADRAGLGPTLRLPRPIGLPAEIPTGFAVEPLACHAPSGSCVQLFFDPQDGRLHGTANAEVSPQHYVRFADWQQFGPLRLPAVRYEGYVSEPPRRIQIDKVTFGSLDPALFQGNPVPTLAAYVDAGPLEVIKHPVPGACQFLVPQVRIDGRVAVSALFDTGATSSCMNADLADQLGLAILTPMQARANAGLAVGTRRWLHALELPGFGFYQVEAAAMATPFLIQLGDHRQPGIILGGEVWEQTAPVLDIRQGRLGMRGAPVAPLVGGTVFTVPLTRARERGALNVAIEVDGKSATAVLDTGMHVALRITLAGLRQIGMPSDADTWLAAGAVPTRTVGAGGKGATDLLAQIDSLRLGVVTFERPWVLLAIDPAGEQAYYEMALGGGVLASFARVGIDLTRQRLELEPGSAMAADGAKWRVPAPGRFLGLYACAPRPGAKTGDEALPTVVEVHARTPADEHGIVVGDRIVAIDGESCAGLEPHRWFSKLWARENRVAVELKKADGKLVRVDL